MPVDNTIHIAIRDDGLYAACDIRQKLNELAYQEYTLGSSSQGVTTYTTYGKHLTYSDNPNCTLTYHYPRSGSRIYSWRLVALRNISEGEKLTIRDEVTHIPDDPDKAKFIVDTSPRTSPVLISNEGYREPDTSIVYSNGVTIQEDVNRAVIQLIKDNISKNNTTLSDEELAVWIYNYYKLRTLNHIGMVQACASYLKPVLTRMGLFEKLIMSVQSHDMDKFRDRDLVAHYALNTPLYNDNLKDLYEITEYSKEQYETVQWENHWSVNPHHPEYWCDKEGNILVGAIHNILRTFGGTPDNVQSAHDKGYVAIAEMIADWMAVGYEMGNSAKEWYLKTHNVKWKFDDEITKYIESLLACEPSKIAIQLPHDLSILGVPKFDREVSNEGIQGDNPQASEIISLEHFYPHMDREVLESSSLHADKHLDQSLLTQPTLKGYFDDLIKYQNQVVVHEADSQESLEENLRLISTEAANDLTEIAKKKKVITDYIVKLYDLIDPSKTNSTRFRGVVDKMSDKDFHKFMENMRDGKYQLHIVAPNLVINIRNKDLLKAAAFAKVKLFHRFWRTDAVTGRRYLTDNEYPIITLPVRRMQQFLDEKMSVPEHDRTIDTLTGQVTGDSRASSITNPEIQILAARGLEKTLTELVNVRGGNIHAYGEFKRMLEETGEASVDLVTQTGRTRTAVVAQVLLRSMMLDTNLLGDE